MSTATAPHPSRLDFADPGDVDSFVAALEAFERGELTSDDWKSFRRLRGVYEQRQDGRHMIRVKIPGGAASAAQLRKVAELAQRHAHGVAHVTTRQCFQLHFVEAARVEEVLRELGTAGLTTREACGNSVRNFTCCPLAGVAAGEPFDVSPYLEALARHFLRGPWSAKLPRKFKPSIGGCCGTDCSQAFINDLGLLARTRDGQPGFKVVAGGALSTLRRSALVVDEFVPAGDILEVAEAIVRVFHHHGNRTNRAKARLKWVIERIGAQAFLELVAGERAAIRAEGGRRFTPAPVVPHRPPPRLPLAAARAPGFAAWAEGAVAAQKQAGFSVVRVRLPLGDLTSAQLRSLAAIVELHGDGEVRTTNDQDVVLRWIPDERLALVHQALVAAGLDRTGAGTLLDVTSCPGATTCQLAVTRSRGAARLLGGWLDRRPDLVAQVPDLIVKVSGCPNSCGQHHVAGIGLQGGMRKLAGRPVPHYLVHVGGGIDGDGARFGRLVGKVPARRLPLVVERLAELVIRERRDGERADRVLARLDPAVIAATLDGLTELSADHAGPDDFVDLDDGDRRHVAGDLAA